MSRIEGGDGPQFSSEQLRLLRYAAATLSVVVAALHLLHPRLGFPRLVIHLQVGTLFDPRPLLFSVSALAMVAGVLLAWNGVPRRPLYAAGMALMVIFLVGYGAWHTVLDHGAFWPHIEGHGHHDMHALEVIVDHLLDDDWALVSKVLEGTLLVLLSILFVTDQEA